MFTRIGRFVVRRPWLVVVAWLVATVALTALAPKLESTTDQADFLPSHYESVQVSGVQERAFPGPDQPAAIAVFQRTDGAALTDADKADIAKVSSALEAKGYAHLKQVRTSPDAVSPDGKVGLANVYADTKDVYDDPVTDDVKQLRTDAGQLLNGTALKLGVTGQAATALDTKDSGSNTDGMIMMATLLLIVVLLGVIFRSPLIALLPVLVIVMVYLTATGLISTASSVFGLTADPSVSTMLIVVLFGVGTDYLLFLLFRYREFLRAGMEPRPAMAEAVARVGETIASAAGAVVVAFLALTLSTMGMLRAMGPSLAIAVAVSLVAGVTLVPAVFALLGRAAFWPSKAWKREPKGALAQKVGGLTARRPGLVAAVSGGLLVALAVGLFGFKADFDSGGSLPDKLESVQAMNTLQRSFSAGQADPTLVFLENTSGGRLSEQQQSAYRDALTRIEGVAQVSAPDASSDGTVARYSVSLTYKPSEEKAIDLVGGALRTQAHAAAPDGSRALVGGTSAVLADIRTAVNHDYTVVFPVAGIAIMLILGLLLRSAVAPWFLMLSVGLGFAGTLGATVWLFQGVKGADGILFTLPILVYLFVVAIGTDYNILMIARLREEIRAGNDPRAAIRHAVAQSAPTMGAAAVILAGTFGVLMLADNSMLQQMGFAVASGILLTAFVMALFLVPAVTTLLGRRAWWPGLKEQPAAAAAGARPDLVDSGRNGG
ncbi:MMPL family transporter [Kitasatospora sp. NA04385]|uniref:MMPL family transporter n=1 Tax=Kitasatospora sp. NA04385 TaxID=2742135 RepID=UPI0011639D80|nr:MMPL family transporter [Kitasatospora sp. NA04385]QDJ74288.1 membrane protein [Kitasatospora sp.]QKW22419.1 MMPL family transporter [Kitasatospora sp. NA04385]